MVHEPAILVINPERSPRRVSRAAWRRWPVLIGILAAIAASLLLWAMIVAAGQALWGMVAG
ncbi:MAG: hypothetical protein GC206_14840 [Alphaproteobacteria bacterium]|nr:hypothetical protein [Alphaproteobacteria bacterium]